MNLSIIIGLITAEPPSKKLATEDQATEASEDTNSNEAYTRTYTSFGGADIVFYCNGEAFGETQAYSVNEITNLLTIDFAVFDINIINRYISLLDEHGRALISYQNEYGDGMYFVIEGISFTGRSFRHSIDDVSITITAHYEFDSLNMLPGRPDETYSDILPNMFFT